MAASSAAPALVARFSTELVPLLKQAVGLLGARTGGVLFIWPPASSGRISATKKTGQEKG